MSRFCAGFQPDAPVVQVRFGPGERHSIGEEVQNLGCARALVLSSPDQEPAARDVAASLGDLAAGVFAGARMHTPVDTSEEAVAYAKSLSADCVVSFGGGSTIGLGKAIALRTGLPQIAIPTTYAGSEATPILGQSEGGVKTTLTDPKVQPQRIIYDPELVATLPIGMTVTSGLNAIAHAAEALYARDRNPLSSSMALEGIRQFAGALPRVVQSPGEIGARGETLYAAWLCGAVLGQVGMSLHHKLCHTLGGSFDLPHAQTHAIILPHAIAYNEAAVPDALAPVAELLRSDSASAGLHALARTLGAPLALKDLGLRESDLDRATDLAMERQYWNPRPLGARHVRQLLQNAWAGSPPEPI